MSTIREATDRELDCSQVVCQLFGGPGASHSPPAGAPVSRSHRVGYIPPDALRFAAYNRLVIKVACSTASAPTLIGNRRDTNVIDMFLFPRNLAQVCVFHLTGRYFRQHARFIREIASPARTRKMLRVNDNNRASTELACKYRLQNQGIRSSN